MTLAAISPTAPPSTTIIIGSIIEAKCQKTAIVPFFFSKLYALGYPISGFIAISSDYWLNTWSESPLKEKIKDNHDYHEDIYDEFVQLFVEKTKKLKLGDPFSEETHVGAVISQSQWDTVDSYVKLAEQEGARVVYGGKRPEGEEFQKGYWYMPTVIVDVTNDMRVAQEEIFGPVVVIIKFKDEKEAIQIANDTIYGLAAAVWTKDFGRAHRVTSQLKAGIIMVNNPFSAFPGLPFGGYKQSGFGRELAIESLDLYMETKSVLSYIGPKPLNPFGV